MVILDFILEIRKNYSVRNFVTPLSFQPSCWSVSVYLHRNSMLMYSTKYRWVPLYPNMVNSKLGFIRSFQFLFDLSSCLFKIRRIWTFVYFCLLFRQSRALYSFVFLDAKWWCAQCATIDTFCRNTNPRKTISAHTHTYMTYFWGNFLGISCQLKSQNWILFDPPRSVVYLRCLRYVEEQK